MRTTWMILAAAAGLAACSSGGAIGGSPAPSIAEKTRTAMTTLDMAAAEQCMSRELQRLGFVVQAGDEQDGSLRSVRPRDEILGVPTSDDYDRIDALVTGVQDAAQRTIRLTIGTFDGNEEENLSPEVRRDADTVLQACS
jgi:hypothetical protein